MKISSLLDARGDEEVFISFEYFPPRTPEGVTALYERIGKMKAYGPLFTDFTWGAGGSTADLTLELTANAKHKFGLVPNMHLTCTNMPKEKVHDALKKCKEAGIKNILALRGDPPAGQEEWEATDGGFTSALCLVKFIRETYGSYFGIGVAGYPEGHPNMISKVDSLEELSESERKRCATVRDENGAVVGYTVCKDADYEAEIEYLFKKVKMGADVIFTQMFFDVDCYCYFVERCRAKGISVPIIPGIMCINSVPGFKRMVSMCKTRVPEDLWARAESTNVDDEDAGRQLGVTFGKDLCRRLLDFGVRGLHFYCLNHEKVPLGILDSLGMSPAGVMESEQQPVDEREANETTSAGKVNAVAGSVLRASNPSAMLAKTAEGVMA